MQKYLMDIRPGSYELQRDPHHESLSNKELYRGVADQGHHLDRQEHGIIHDNFRVVVVTKFKLEDYLDR